MPSGDTPVTITGNLTADPELRYTPNGVAVATFTIASAPRVHDPATGQWKDGSALFLRCVAWRQLAEHAAESLAKGTRAVVTGRLRQRDYDPGDGTRRTVYEVDVDDAGPSLKFATAKVTKATRRRGSGTDGYQQASPADASDSAPPF